MSHYLVAVDGSEAAGKAAQMAVDLAAKTQAKVTFVYCVVPIVNTAEMVWVPSADFDRAQERAGEQILAEAQARFATTGVTLATRLLRGPAAETIADEAKRPGYDLLVVGSHGYGVVKRLLLGSVATRLLHVCEKPILVVR